MQFSDLAITTLNRSICKYEQHHYVYYGYHDDPHVRKIWILACDESKFFLVIFLLFPVIYTLL